MMNTMSQLTTRQTRWTVMPTVRPFASSNSTWLRTPVGFLEATSHIPVLTAALGEDLAGAPVLIDFTNASSFPMQVFASPEYRRALMETMIQSACTINYPEEFQFAIISSHPEDYEAVCDSGFISEHCRGNASTPAEGMHWLVEFAAKAQQHQKSRFSGTRTLLVVDDFSTYLNSDPEVKIAWQWLTRYGVNAGVLPAFLNDAHFIQFNFSHSHALHFLDLDALHDWNEIGTEPAIDLSQAQTGHFFVQSNGKWLAFNVPAICAA
jgi:hypothetical protein